PLRPLEGPLPGAPAVGIRLPVLAVVVAPGDLRTAEAWLRRGEPEPGGRRVAVNPGTERQGGRRHPGGAGWPAGPVGGGGADQGGESQRRSAERAGRESRRI